MLSPHIPSTDEPTRARRILNRLALSIAIFAVVNASDLSGAENELRWKVAEPLPSATSAVSVVGHPKPSATEKAALVFDGAGDGLVLANNLLEGASAFTVELLIRPAADGLEEQRFFHAACPEDQRVLLELRLDPKTRLWSLDTHLRNNDAEKLTLLDRTLGHSSGAWHWVALTYDGKTMRSYVDGKPELSGPVNFSPMKPGQTSVGVRLNKVSWFKGEIAELRISRRTLAEAELQKP